MKKSAFISILAFVVLFRAEAQLFPNLGGQRVGISSLTFLNNDVSPRSIGMGGMNVSMSGDGYAMFTNPASMIDPGQPVVAMSNYFLFEDINNSYVSAIVPHKDEGAFGFSMMGLNAGRMEKRTEFQPNGTGEYFTATNMAFGAGYARKLSNMFSFGVNAKYVYEQLAEFYSHNALVDLGFLYRTDYKDIQFAAYVQNFGFNSRLDGDQNSIPVSFNRNEVNLEGNPVASVFKFGMSFKPYKTERNSLLIGAQLNHPNDDAESIRMGAEYEWMELFYARTGFKVNVRGEKAPTFGMGIRSKIGRHALVFDYGVNPTRYLGFQHIVGLSLRLAQNKEAKQLMGE